MSTTPSSATRPADGLVDRVATKILADRENRHLYVLDADDVVTVTKSIGWRLSQLGDLTMRYSSGDPTITAVMLGETLLKVQTGVLDRIGNVVAARTLFLYADHAGLDQVRTGEADSLGDRLFRDRMRVDRANRPTA